MEIRSKSFPEKPAGRRRGKQLQKYYIGHIGLHHVFWETQRLSHIMYLYICVWIHLSRAFTKDNSTFNKRNLQYNGVEMFLMWRSSPTAGSKQQEFHDLLSQREQCLFLLICYSYAQLPIISSPTSYKWREKKRLKLHSLLTFPFYSVSSALSH